MTTEMEKKYPWIYQRHNRKVISHPEGVIAHDGDCGIWRLFRICTCGLHHELMCNPDEAEKIYPKYWDEQDGIEKIDMLMNIEHHEGGLWIQCNKCEGKGGLGEIKCEACEGKGLVLFKMPDPPTEEELAERTKIIENMFNMYKKKKEEESDKENQSD